jgi:WD40 repeat protein
VHVLRHQGDVDHCQLGAVADTASSSSSSSGAASESAASGPAVVVASASSDQTVRVWNAESGECLWALRVAGFVGGLQLDWPARRLACIELGGRHTVQLFDAEQRVRLHAFEHANITVMRFDAHKLLTLSPDCLKLFNVQSGALVWSVPKHTSESVLDAAGDKVVCAGR